MIYYRVEYVVHHEYAHHVGSYTTLDLAIAREEQYIEELSRRRWGDEWEGDETDWKPCMTRGPDRFSLPQWNGEGEGIRIRAETLENSLEGT